MRLLIDTHVLILALEDSSKLSRKANELLQDPDHEHWVSAASVWRIAIKLLLAQCEAETLRLLSADKVLADIPTVLAV